MLRVGLGGQPSEYLDVVDVLLPPWPAAAQAGAVVCTLALPLTLLFLGLRFASILLGDRRRALQDIIAATAVIYSWDARAARLRFLSSG